MSGLRWKWTFDKEYKIEPKKELLAPYRHQNLIEKENEETEEETKVFCLHCKYWKYPTECTNNIYKTHEVVTALKKEIYFPWIGNVNRYNDCLHFENNWHRKLWDWFTH